MGKSCAPVAAICAVILFAPALAAERDTYRRVEDSAPKTKNHWWWPFSSGTEKSKKAAPKPAAQAKKQEPQEPTASSATTAEKRNLTQAQADYLRRLAVCDRLREVALDLGDESLHEQADLLEQRAWVLYERRTEASRFYDLAGRTPSAPRAGDGSPAGDRAARAVRSVSSQDRVVGEE
ncbi:MAG: hypothetical protein C4297_05350 [Gemmataceae bacterium]